MPLRGGFENVLVVSIVGKIVVKVSFAKVVVGDEGVIEVSFVCVVVPDLALQELHKAIPSKTTITNILFILITTILLEFLQYHLILNVRCNVERMLQLVLSSRQLTKFVLKTIDYAPSVHRYFPSAITGLILKFTG